MINKFLLFLLALGAWLPSAAAVCIYNAAENAVWIYDYPENVPARPRHLLFFEQINDWGLIRYDASNDTYTVNANLWIGRNDGSDTYFQIGAPDHPHETLVLNGKLVIYPARIAGENLPEYKPGINHLRIGLPDQPEICARLLFRKAPGKSHTLHTGAYYRGDRMTGAVSGSGRLHVHYGVIAPLEDAQPIRGNLYMYLSEVLLDHARLSRVTGTLAYGAQDGPYSKFAVNDTVFEYGGSVTAWGRQQMRGATFRQMNTVFGGANIPLDAHLTECRFMDNNANWELRPCGGLIELVDCEINPPRKGNRYAARVDAGAPDLRVVSSRHVILRVTDPAGRPIGAARVEVLCEQDAAFRHAATTDARGLTPGRGLPGALLLDEWEETAGTAENQPVRREFSYTVNVKPGPGTRLPAQAGFHPTQSWAVIEVVAAAGVD